MDKAIDDAIASCEPRFASADDHIFCVTVLSRNKRPMLTGRALLLGGCSLFWSDIPVSRAVQLRDAAFLRDLDGTVVAIADLRACGKSTRVHYHFRLASAEA